MSNRPYDIAERIEIIQTCTNIERDTALKIACQLDFVSSKNMKGLAEAIRIIAKGKEKE